MNRSAVFKLSVLFQFLFILSLSNTANAIDPTSGSHQILSADFNGDGHLDYLFKSEKQFVLIANRGIRVPIFIDTPDAMLQSQPNGQFNVVTTVSETISSSSIWQPSTTSTLAVNLNGDSYGDLILLAPGYEHRGVTLYGASGDGLTIGHYIDESLIGSSALANFDTITTRDSDNNGTDDLLFYDNGTVIAVAYSSGNQFSSVTQAESAAPFEVTSQWSYVAETNQDVFSPVPPNNAGISVNRVDSFNMGLSEKAPKSGNYFILSF